WLPRGRQIWDQPGIGESGVDGGQVGPSLETLRDTLSGLGAEPAAESRVQKESFERVGEADLVLWGHQEPGLTVNDRLPDTGQSRADDRKPVCHRLEQHVGQTVAVTVREDLTRQGKDGCLPILSAHLGLR